PLRLILNRTSTPEINTLSLQTLFRSPANGRLYFTAKQTFAQQYGTEYIVRISTTSQTDIASFSTELVSLSEDGLGPLGWDTCFEDRKSTRLNFSHVKISYAVFCLKKK